jgi:hypothetical protein
MFDGKPFFIIPIYRSSPEKYFSEIEERRQKIRKDLLS